MIASRIYHPQTKNKQKEIKHTQITYTLGWPLSKNKQTENNKYWRGYGKTETLVQCWWECIVKWDCSYRNRTATIWLFLKKLIILPHDLANPLLGMYPNELKAGSEGDTYIPMFKAALLTIPMR